MEFKDLTDEQKAAVKNVKSQEELLELAKEEGYELTDEQLKSVAGAGGWTNRCQPNVCDE